MLKGPLDKYVIKDFYNFKPDKEPKSKLEVIAKGVKVIMKSTFNYLKKYVSATPETGDEGSKYHKKSNRVWR